MTHKAFKDLSDAEKGALLLAHHEGKRIEWLCTAINSWRHISNPFFWHRTTYRIAPEPKTPDSINWDHVSEEWNWLARDQNGRVYLFREEPRLEGDEWFTNPLASIGSHASYRRGTVEWTDSLIIRPGHEEAV